MINLKKLIWAQCIFFFFVSIANASYDEGVSGDLSGDFTLPTGISLSAGSNIVSGSVGANGFTGATDGTDADYFSFTLSSGQTLDAINILSSSGDNVSFFGYTANAAFTGQASGDIDGFVLFGNTSGNVLTSLVGGHVTGVTHSFWLQETTSVIQSYSIDFVVTEVPLPGAAFLLLSSLGALVVAKRRK